MIEALQGACIRAVGIDLQTVEDIDQVLWTKFVTLCAFSGATSLMRAGIGPILADPESRIFIEQLRDEGMAVASAAGYPMPDGYAEQVISLWRTFPPETRSSMSHRSLPRQADRTRMAVGTLATRWETKLGVPTPAHTAVYRALHLHAERIRTVTQARPGASEGGE